VDLPILTVGHVSVPVRGADGVEHEVAVVERAPDLNAAVYDPRLLAGVDVVVTSGNIRDRFLADPARYPAQGRFYALLDSTAEIAARFTPHGPEDGPVITVYRATPRLRSALAALGPLPPLWWLAGVSPSYRPAFERLRGLPPEDSTLDARGEPAAWVASLHSIFARQFSEFAEALAFELGKHGAHAPARDLAGSVILMMPEELGACLTYTVASRRTGNWDEALRMLERTLAAADHARLAVPGAARLEHADLLAHAGDRAHARALYDSLAVDADSMLASLAKERLVHLEGRGTP
jgi:hypothetical protein